MRRETTSADARVRSRRQQRQTQTNKETSRQTKRQRVRECEEIKQREREGESISSGRSVGRRMAGITNRRKTNERPIWVRVWTVWKSPQSTVDTTTPNRQSI